MQAGFDELYIDGKFAAAEAGRSYENIDPATEESLGRAPDASLADARRAIAAARRSFDSGVWSEAPLAERARVMRQILDAIERHRFEVAEITVAEVGHPVAIAELFGNAALANAAWIAEQAGRDFGYLAEPIRGEKKVTHRQVLREPVGVVSAILPFNAPIPVASYKTLSAIACGNSVVMKPSPLTPFSALWFAKIAAETDLPPGVLNVVTGSGVEIGVELCESPGVDMVSFTGSPEVGAAIMASAAKTLKRVMLELGGKSAQIVLDDAPLEQAAAIAAASPMALSGQGCSLPTRILVPRAQQAEFLEVARAVVESLRVGSPKDRAVQMGPVVSAAQRARVERYVEIAQREGARLLTGGCRPPDLPRGYFYAPTLFCGVESGMAIAREEVFGPVGAILAYEGDDDAVRIANDSVYGLGGNILSSNPKRSLALARRIRTGQVWINTPLTDERHCLPYPDVPFGGYKQSGIGREMGIEGYLEYTETKTVAATF